MIIYLIRHGHAQDRLYWKKSDLERPLINKGLDRADKAFAKFFSIYQIPDVIVTSEAVRAEETAEVLLRHCKGADIVTRGALNPGADVGAYLSVINEYKDIEALAIIGHEPDMSEFASSYTSESKLNIKLKKGSIIHIEDGCLVNLVQQKVLL